MSQRTYRQRKADQAVEWARIRGEILAAWARGEAVTEMKIRPGTGRAVGPFIPVTTLQNYVRQVYADLDVKNAPAAVAEGYRRGFLPCSCLEPMRRSDVRRHAQSDVP